MTHRDHLVAITGMGVLSPVGRNLAESWAAIRDGRSGCRPIRRFPASSFPVRVAAEVPREYWEPLQHKSLAYTFGERAIAEALVMADLSPGDLGPDTALVVGVGGDDDSSDQPLHYLDALISESPGQAYAELGEVAARHSEFGDDRVNLESLASALALRFGIEGEVLCVATACASGAHAIAIAADLLHWGVAKRAVAVGTDAMVSQLNLSNFCMLGVLSRRNQHPETASRPFDTRRQGFVLGEGAGAVVLERVENPRALPPQVRGFLTGYGVSADAYSITDKESDGSGVLLAIEQALQAAGLRPEEIGYINAHGTGTLKNDIGEVAAIRRAFGPSAGRVPISSIKGQIGHTIAAAGAIEAIVTLLAVSEGQAPGTSTLEIISPDFVDLRILGPGMHPVARRPGLSIAAGFGGVNVCLIVEPPEVDDAP